MIKNLTLELEVKVIDQMELTEQSIWIWAIDSTKSYSDWERIRIWQEHRFGRMEVRWSPNSSDISHTRTGWPPYTHYIILPRISIY